MAPSGFKPGQIGTGLALTFDSLSAMLGVLTLLGHPTPIGSDLAFVGPPMLDGV